MASWWERDNTYVGRPEHQCRGKRTFRKKAAARLFIRRLRFGAQQGMSAYRCPHCDGFHVGHKPPPPKGVAS